VEVSVLQLVTGAVALYAALLSTMVFVANLMAKKSRVRLSAWQGQGFVEATGQQIPDQVVVTATNVGEVDVLLVAMAMVPAVPQSLRRFRARWRRALVMTGPQREGKLPHKLKPSEQVTMLIPAIDFLAGLPEGGWDLGKTRLTVQDSYGKYHCSPRLSKCLSREVVDKYGSGRKAENMA